MNIENTNNIKNTQQDSKSVFSGIRSFLKYFSNGKDDVVINSLFSNHKIRFTQPWVLNDPFEFNPILKFRDDGQNYVRYLYNGVLFGSEEDKLRMGFIEWQINRLGILSLTKIPDSFDMWSRYANGHKGFLIEFKSDFNKYQCMLSREGREYPIKQVTYVDEYAIDIDLLADAQSHISLDRFNDEMFYKKVSRWQNEVEYRMVRELADCPGYKPMKSTPYRDDKLYLFDFDLNCIESVTFGACMSAENKKTIISYCGGYEIKFAQAVVWRDKKDADSFSGKIDIIPAEKLPRLLDMSDFSFFLQEDHIKRPLPIAISRLSDIPYYKEEGMAEWIEEIYKIKKTKRDQNN